MPLNAHVGCALEGDIRALRFAYARDGRLRGTSPPPKSVPFGIVPESIQRMFHAAFTEDGVRGGRPDATTWMKALGDLGRHIFQCPKYSIHRFPDHLGTCPWCTLERERVVLFPQPASSSPIAVYDIHGAWKRIEAIVAPAIPRAPSIDKRGLVARPLPPNTRAEDGKGFFSGLVSGFRSGFERSTERTRREQALATARKSLQALVDTVPVACGVEPFQQRKGSLARLRDEYLVIEATKAKEIGMIRERSTAEQKRRFLVGLPVSAAQVRGVGVTKKVALHAAGVRSAADISFERLMGIKGFGVSSARAMVAWRADAEHRFRFDPRLLPQADIAAVHATSAQRRKEIEEALDAGPTELGTLASAARSKIKALAAQLEQAAATVAQAEVDLTVF
ncbi:MAG: hypothetical protein ACKO3G_00230 [Planctomycetaceae bacterium]